MPDLGYSDLGYGFGVGGAAAPSSGQILDSFELASFGAGSPAEVVGNADTIIAEQVFDFDALPPGVVQVKLEVVGIFQGDPDATQGRWRLKTGGTIRVDDGTLRTTHTGASGASEAIEGTTGAAFARPAGKARVYLTGASLGAAKSCKASAVKVNVRAA